MINEANRLEKHLGIHTNSPENELHRMKIRAFNSGVGSGNSDITPGTLKINRDIAQRITRDNRGLRPSNSAYKKRHNIDPYARTDSYTKSPLGLPKGYKNPLGPRPSGSGDKVQVKTAPASKLWNNPLLASSNIRGFKREHVEGKTYSQFITEARQRPAQRASKRGVVSKPGLKSGKSSPPLHIKMAGMPGSGKSTMAKKLADQTGGISTGYDDARMTIHGTRANQTRFPEVHQLTMSRLKNANPKKPRILDNTNVNPRFKNSTDDALRHEAGFKDPIISMTPRTSIRAAFRRNSRRGPNEQVPRTVMRIMAKQYKNYRNSNEGQQATRTGDALTKQYALNRRTGNSRRSNAERTRRSNQK